MGGCSIFLDPVLSKFFEKKKKTRLALWSQGIELVGYMQPYLRMIIQRLLDKNPRLVDLVFCNFQ